MTGDHPKYSIIKIGQNTEKSWRLEETCCLSNFCGRPLANAGVKNSQRSKIMIILIIKRQILGSCQKVEKAMAHEGDRDTESSTLGTVCKGLKGGLEEMKIIGRIKTIQTTTVLKSAWILWRVLKTCGDLLLLRQTPVENQQLKLMRKTLIIIMIIDG